MPCDMYCEPLSDVFNIFRQERKVKVGGCRQSLIGDYLNEIENTKIKAHSKNEKYSGFFWFDKQISKSRHVLMLGHGGQGIYIDLEKGSVLVYHSITRDYDADKYIWRLIK